MRQKLFSILTAGLTAFGIGSASAQTVTLGGDNDQIGRILKANGYTKGRVTKRGLTIIRTEACKGNERYRVKVSILGRITSTQKIADSNGECAPVRTAFDSREAVKALRNDGFTEIKADRRGGLVIATACYERRRYEINFNRSGKLVDRRVIGRCGDAGLSKEEITAVMKREGYKRIVVTDDKIPTYVAEACKDQTRLRVVMNRRGTIRSERRIGDCASQLNPGNLTTLLEKNGYDRVRVVQNRRPPFVARACKGRQRVELEVGRFGRIRGERRIRTCRTAVEPSQLAGLLEKEGYDRVKILRKNSLPYLVEACNGTTLAELTIGRYGRIQGNQRVGRCAQPISEGDLMAELNKQDFVNIDLKRRDGGWRAEVCKDEVKVALRYDAYGDLIRDRRIGECASQSVLDVMKTLESRGANSTQMLIEGCYAGTKYRWEFNRLGTRTGRERIGNC